MKANIGLIIFCSLIGIIKACNNRCYCKSGNNGKPTHDCCIDAGGRPYVTFGSYCDFDGATGSPIDRFNGCCNGQGYESHCDDQC